MCGALFPAAPGSGRTRTGSRNGNVPEPLARGFPQDGSCFLPSTGRGGARGQISHVRTGQSPRGHSDWWVRDFPSVFLLGKQVTGIPAHCRSSYARVRKRKVAYTPLPAVSVRAAITPALAPELPTTRLQDGTPASHPGGPEGLSWL
uniref:Uncharacterized protein n=1 Tax=Rousettus aegyptiacus TaxID=9407 RepID=A0A7J8HSX1_ROUAE|nr:hypothetical protein HJG63_011098 [Rousettus aegyptiacus]